MQNVTNLRVTASRHSDLQTNRLNHTDSIENNLQFTNGLFINNDDTKFAKQNYYYTYF